MREFSEQVFFKPWVGKNYDAGGAFGTRVLILGESHYQWDRKKELTPTLTEECVMEQCSGDGTKAFWTNIVTAGLGRSPTLEDKRTFWDSIAFYNFVQSSAGFGPRVRPTAALWEQAIQPFLEVLEALMPHLVVVLGRKLWTKLPEEFAGGPRLGPDKSVESRWYIVGDATGRARTVEPALAVVFRHPSSGFSPGYWHTVFRAALEHVAAQRCSPRNILALPASA